MTLSNIDYHFPGGNGSAFSIYAAQSFPTAELTTGGIDSEVLDIRAVDELVLHFINESDTQIDFQVQVTSIRDAPDDEWEDLGNMTSLSAGDSNKQTDYDTIATTHFNWLRVSATANTSNATTGSANVRINGGG